MLMLTVSRRLIWAHASVAGGRWRGNGPAPRMYELFDKTLGIVGLGTIGKKVARLAQAFGMRVAYYDIARLAEDTEDALGVRFRLLRELLKSSDVASLHVPLNDSTRGMIGAGELGLMKREAILINTCRGPVVDEAALTRALAEGKLFGAGLDVFDQEPTPPGNPLIKLDNVVLSAHFAGPTWDNHVARFRNGFDNVERVARGEPPLWVVPELADVEEKK
jgi:phosphoglycerate dehydrogenase-like enzyme